MVTLLLLKMVLVSGLVKIHLCGFVKQNVISIFHNDAF